MGADELLADADLDGVADDGDSGRVVPVEGSEEGWL